MFAKGREKSQHLEVFDNVQMAQKNKLLVSKLRIKPQICQEKTSLS